MAMRNDLKMDLKKTSRKKKPIKTLKEFCLACGSVLAFSHQTHYKSLLIEETSHCLDCKDDQSFKEIHRLN